MRIRFLASAALAVVASATVFADEPAAQRGSLSIPRVSVLYVSAVDRNGAAVTDKDIVGPAVEAERLFHYTSLGPSTAPNIRKLAALNPRTLAVMHGASYHGNAGRALHALADHYDAELSAAMLARAA